MSLCIRASIPTTLVSSSSVGKPQGTDVVSVRCRASNPGALQRDRHNIHWDDVGHTMIDDTLNWALLPLCIMTGSESERFSFLEWKSRHAREGTAEEAKVLVLGPVWHHPIRQDLEGWHFRFSARACHQNLAMVAYLMFTRFEVINIYLHGFFTDCRCFQCYLKSKVEGVCDSTGRARPLAGDRISRWGWLRFCILLFVFGGH